MDELRETDSATNTFDRLIFPTLMLVLGIVSIFTIDASVGRYFRIVKPSGEFRDFIDATEHFGTPYGQVLSLMCVTAAMGWKEWRIVRIFLGASVAGLCANLGKLCVQRIRPSKFDFDSQSILESFVGWFPLGKGGSDFQSFPSAHTASAFGFAALLTWAYPKGRPAFLLLAFLVAVHRVVTSAHYPSDVFIGGAIGWFVGWFFASSNPISRWFDRLETKRHSSQL